MMKFSNKENLGITLVALVITIIILLILAGVAIAQLQDNGLFEKSKLAKEKAQNAQDLEEDILKQYENGIDSYLYGYRNFGVIDYSEDEQDTGIKWLDGKSIHQKTVQVTMPSSSSDVEVVLQNYDNVINISGWFLNSDNNYITMNPSYYNMINLYYKKTNNKLHVDYSGNLTWAYGKTAYITFQYTVNNTN